MITAGTVSVGTSATLIYETPSGVDTRLLLTSGNANEEFFIGGDDSVSESSGYLVNPASGIFTGFEIKKFRGSVYGVFASGSANVTYLAEDTQ